MERSISIDEFSHGIFMIPPFIPVSYQERMMDYFKLMFIV